MSGRAESGGALEHETGPEGTSWPDHASRPEAGTVLPASTGSMPEELPEQGNDTQAVADHPAPAGAPVAVPGTGELRVDAALRLLDRLPELPVSEHPGLFEQVHAQLTDVLGELDTGPGGAAS